MGADGRRYLLDLYRVTPVDIVFQEEVEKEAETNPYPHKMTLLRPELVDYYYEHKLREYLKIEKVGPLKLRGLNVSALTNTAGETRHGNRKRKRGRGG